MNSPDNMKGARALVRRFRLNPRRETTWVITGIRHNYSNCRGPALEKVTFHLVDRNGHRTYLRRSDPIRTTLTDVAIEVRVENVDCLFLGFSFTLH